MAAASRSLPQILLASTEICCTYTHLYRTHRNPSTPRTLESGDRGQWLRWFVQYLRENELSWNYWPLNEMQSSGEKRNYGEAETYGLLTPDYQHIAAPEIVRLLQTIVGSPQPHNR